LKWRSYLNDEREFSGLRQKSFCPLLEIRRTPMTRGVLGRVQRPLPGYKGA
jgi:hypothetical protein